jgi:restriction system protein
MRASEESWLRAQLARIMIRHGVGCRVEETLTIKKLDEEFFE